MNAATRSEVARAAQALEERLALSSSRPDITAMAQAATLLRLVAHGALTPRDCHGRFTTGDA